MPNDYAIAGAGLVVAGLFLLVLVLALSECFYVRRIYAERFVAMRTVTGSLERAIGIYRRRIAASAYYAVGAVGIPIVGIWFFGGPWTIAAFVVLGLVSAVAAYLYLARLHPVAALILTAATRRGRRLHGCVRRKLESHRVVSLLDTDLWPEMNDAKYRQQQAETARDAARNIWEALTELRSCVPRERMYRRELRLELHEELAMELARALPVVIVDRREGNPIVERLWRRMEKEKLGYKIVTIEPLAEGWSPEDYPDRAAVLDPEHAAGIACQALSRPGTLPTERRGVRWAGMEA